MQDNTYKWTKLDNQSPATYTSVSLIGDFNSWGGDVDLEKLPAIDGNDSHNWYVRYTVPATGGLKFRADHDWATSWGVDKADKDKAIGDTYHLTPWVQRISMFRQVLTTSILTISLVVGTSFRSNNSLYV